MDEPGLPMPPRLPECAEEAFRVYVEMRGKFSDASTLDWIAHRLMACCPNAQRLEELILELEGENQELYLCRRAAIRKEIRRRRPPIFVDGCNDGESRPAGPRSSPIAFAAESNAAGREAGAAQHPVAADEAGAARRPRR